MTKKKLEIVSACIYFYIRVGYVHMGRQAKAKAGNLTFKLTLKWFYSISKGHPFSNIQQAIILHLTVKRSGSKMKSE